MDNNDPLAKLIAADTKGADRKKLADILEPYVEFDQTSHEVNFKDKFRELRTNAEKLEVILLADKARTLVFNDGKKEGMSQSEVLTVEAMPKGSVKSTLKMLSDSRKILKTTEGKYYIPGYRLSELFSKFK